MNSILYFVSYKVLDLKVFRSPMFFYMKSAKLYCEGDYPIIWPY